MVSLVNCIEWLTEEGYLVADMSDDEDALYVYKEILGWLDKLDKEGLDLAEVDAWFVNEIVKRMDKLLALLVRTVKNGMDIREIEKKYGGDEDGEN